MLCVNLFGPYVLKGKDGSEVDFVCLTMMDPVTNWFKIVELSVVDKPGSKTSDLNVSTEYFEKTSRKIVRLVNKLCFLGTLVTNTLLMTMAANLSYTTVN